MQRQLDQLVENARKDAVRHVVSSKESKIHSDVTNKERDLGGDKERALAKALDRIRVLEEQVNVLRGNEARLQDQVQGLRAKEAALLSQLEEELTGLSSKVNILAEQLASSKAELGRTRGLLEQETQRANNAEKKLSEAPLRPATGAPAASTNETVRALEVANKELRASAEAMQRELDTRALTVDALQKQVAAMTARQGIQDMRCRDLERQMQAQLAHATHLRLALAAHEHEPSDATSGQSHEALLAERDDLLRRLKIAEEEAEAARIKHVEERERAKSHVSVETDDEAGQEKQKLETELREARERLRDAEESMQLLVAKTATMEYDLADKEMLIRSLNVPTEGSGEVSAGQAVCEELVALREERDVFNGRVVQLERELGGANDRLRELEKRVGEGREKGEAVESLLGKLKRREGELVEAEKRERELGKRVHAAERALEEVMGERDRLREGERRRGMEGEGGMARLKVQVEELEGRVQELTQTNVRLKAQLREAERANEQLRIKEADWEKEAIQAREEGEALRTALGLQETMLAEMRSESERGDAASVAGSDRDAARRRHVDVPSDDYGLTLARLEDECETLRKTLDSERLEAESALSQAQDRMERLIRERDSLADVVTAMEEQISSTLEHAVVQVKRENETLVRKVRALEENQKRAAAAAQQRTDDGALKARVSELESELAKLRRENEDLLMSSFKEPGAMSPGFGPMDGPSPHGLSPGPLGFGHGLGGSFGPDPRVRELEERVKHLEAENEELVWFQWDDSTRLAAAARIEELVREVEERDRRMEEMKGGSRDASRDESRDMVGGDVADVLALEPGEASQLGRRESRLGGGGVGGGIQSSGQGQGRRGVLPGGAYLGLPRFMQPTFSSLPKHSAYSRDQAPEAHHSMPLPRGRSSRDTPAGSHIADQPSRDEASASASASPVSNATTDVTGHVSLYGSSAGANLPRFMLPTMSRQTKSRDVTGPIPPTKHPHAAATALASGARASGVATPDSDSESVHAAAAAVQRLRRRSHEFLDADSRSNGSRDSDPEPLAASDQRAGMLSRDQPTAPATALNPNYTQPTPPMPRYMQPTQASATPRKGHVTPSHSAVGHVASSPIPQSRDIASGSVPRFMQPTLSHQSRLGRTDSESRDRQSREVESRDREAQDGDSRDKEVSEGEPRDKNLVEAEAPQTPRGRRAQSRLKIGNNPEVQSSSNAQVT